MKVNKILGTIACIFAYVGFSAINSTPVSLDSETGFFEKFIQSFALKSTLKESFQDYAFMHKAALVILGAIVLSFFLEKVRSIKILAAFLSILFLVKMFYEKYLISVIFDGTDVSTKYLTVIIFIAGVFAMYGSISSKKTES